MPDPTLLERLHSSELLTPEQLAELARRVEAGDPDPRALAKVVYDRGWMTRFQLSYVAAGRGKELRVGNYVLLDRLGEGGMGQVFKARHSHMDRLVALKLIRKEKLSKETTVARFNQEVRAAAQLSHPNIVLAFDAGQADNVHFFIMEYVDGVDLGRLVVKKGALPVVQACDFVRQAALGLQHAHERGLVHRDIKPSNLLVTRESPPVVKILDMGLARLGDSFEKERNLTKMGQVLGTPDYLAPEQALDSRNVDSRADIYSLGCTLYFLLTDKSPFRAETLAELLMKHQMEAPPRLRKVRPEAPKALETLMASMLAKRPEDRPATAGEVATALEPFARGETGAVKGVSISLPPPSSAADAFATLNDEEEGLLVPRTPTRVGRDRGRDTMIEPPRERKVTRDRKFSRKKTNRQPLLIGACVGAGVLLLVTTIVAAVMFSRKGDSTGKDKYGKLDKGGKEQGGDSREKDKNDGKKDVLTGAEAAPKGTTIDRIGTHVAFKGHAGRGIQALAVAPDGKHAATAGQDDTIIVWDLDREKALWRFSALPAPADSLAFSIDGRRLIASVVGNFFEWDLDTGKRESRPGAPDARLSPDGRKALSFEAIDGKSWTRIWEVSTAKQQDPVPGPGPPKIRTAFNRDCKRAVAIGPALDLLRYDLEKGRPFGKLKLNLQGSTAIPSAVCWGRTEDEVFVGWSDGIIRYFPFNVRATASSIDWRHPGELGSMAVSPDGKRVLTTCTDKFIRLLDIALRPTVRLYAGHNGSPGIALFCPGDQKAISADSDGTLIVWDLKHPSEIKRPRTTTPPPPVQRGKPIAGEVRSLVGPFGFQVRSVLFSADGTRALSAFGAEVVVHELASGAVLQHHRPAPSSLLAVAASKDWKRVLSSGADKSLRLWNLVSGKQEKVLGEGMERVHTQIAVSPDGNYALSSAFPTSAGAKAELLLWDLETGRSEQLFRGESAVFISIAFTDDGRYAVASSPQIPLLIWDLKAKTIRHTIRVSADGLPAMVKIAPAGKSLVLLGKSDGALELWDCEAGKKVKKFTGKHLAGVDSLAVSADGKKAVSVSGRCRSIDMKLVLIDPSLRVWDVDRGIEVARGELSEMAHSVAVSPDGRYALVGDSQVIHYVDLTLLKSIGPSTALQPFTGHKGKVTSIAVSRDGRYVASGGEDGTVRIWEASSGKQLHSLINGGAPFCLRFSRDGSRVVSFGGGQASVAWDVQTGAQLHRFLENEGTQTISGDISANNRYTVFPKRGGLLSYCPVKANLFKFDSFKAAADVTSVVSLADKDRFAIGDTAGWLRTFHATQQVETGRFKLHRGSILSLDWHFPTLMLVSGGADNRIYIVPEKSKPYFITAHSDEVTGVSFSADGKYIVSGSKDRTIRVHNLQRKELNKFTDNDEVLGVAYDPSGKRVLSCGRTIRVWDLAMKR